MNGEQWQHKKTVGNNIQDVQIMFDREDAPPKTVARRKGKTSTKQAAAAPKKQRGASKKTKK